MEQETTTEPRMNPRKVREGVVVSNAMDRTAVVAIIQRKPHRRYGKTVAHTSKLYVHDPGNDLNVGDRVQVQETRPVSKLKHWRILTILERAK